LIVPDDPCFTISAELPPFNFDAVEQDLAIRGDTQMTLSELSPLDTPSDGSSVLHAALNIPRSSPINNGGLPLPFRRSTSLLGAKLEFDDPIAHFHSDDAEGIPLGDFGLDIDADGNIVESQVPPVSVHGPAGPLQDIDDLELLVEEDLPVFQEDDLEMNLRSEIFADYQAAQQRHGTQRQLASTAPAMTTAGVEQDDGFNEPHVAPQRSTTRHKKSLVDEVTEIAREKQKELNENYVERMMKENRAKARRAARGKTEKEARESAFDMVFGRGIGDVGRLLGVGGVQHPLAEHFAGKALARSIGLEVPDDDDEDESEDETKPTRHGKRRLSLEEDEVERGVRRAGAAPQPLGAVDDGLPLFLGDDPPIEAPRAHEETPLGHSQLPWNPPSSALRSTVRDSAKRGATGRSQLSQASPLQDRGSILPIERFSDNPHDEGLSQGRIHSEGQALGLSDSGASLGPYSLPTSDALTQAHPGHLDEECRSFFRHVRMVCAQKGSAFRDNEEVSAGEEESQKQSGTLWVDFEQLLGDEQPPAKSVATRAFYHVLTLATRSSIKVSQKQSFGTIRVGVPLQPTEKQGGDSDIDMHFGDDDDDDAVEGETGAFRFGGDGQEEEEDDGEGDREAGYGEMNVGSEAWSDLIG